MQKLSDYFEQYKQKLINLTFKLNFNLNLNLDIDLYSRMPIIKKIIIVSLTILTGCSLNISRSSDNNILKNNLPGFSTTPYYGEQQLRLNFDPGVSVLINVPDSFYVNKPTGVILFATPNGNTIEETFGKKLEPGDDWHFNIQHIGAQTRFIRAIRKESEHRYGLSSNRTKELAVVEKTS